MLTKLIPTKVVISTRCASLNQGIASFTAWVGIWLSKFQYITSLALLAETGILAITNLAIWVNTVRKKTSIWKAGVLIINNKFILAFYLINILFVYELGTTQSPFSALVELQSFWLFKIISRFLLYFLCYIIIKIEIVIQPFQSWKHLFGLFLKLLFEFIVFKIKFGLVGIEVSNLV